MRCHQRPLAGRCRTRAGRMWQGATKSPPLPSVVATVRRPDGSSNMDSPGRMASTRHARPWWPSTTLVATVLAAVGVTGCVPLGGYSSVVVTPAPSSAPAVSTMPAAISRNPSLAAIIDNQLQPGHYAEGERSLRRYLKQHPGDRVAQGMLRQLTVDPERRLGSRSHAHVVQAGESYSTLADRYLGDASLFLILARYNGSTNPSLLRTGQTLRIPLSARSALPATPTPATGPAAAAPPAV